MTDDDDVIELNDVRADVPDPPAMLGENAKRYWRDLAPKLVDAKAIGKLDLPLLQTACELLGAKDRFYEAFRDSPPVEEGRRDEAVKNRAWTQYRQCVAEARQVLKQLGIGPKARQALDIDLSPKTGDIDPMEEAFGGEQNE